MTPLDPAKALDLIREAVLEQSYIMTPHAVLEMRRDKLDIIDVEAAILTGSVNRYFDDDPRGRRYEVVGQACDLTTPVAVVARFAGKVLIITVYEI